MRSFITSLYAFALSLGGPGLFTVAALDSSFVSLPQINDLLVVLMVTQNKAWMPYYAAMATLGSVAGCSVIYFLAKKGGEALLRRRVSSGRVDRALALYRRHGVLALMVPALLPPPAPFKLFVLGAGVAGVRPLKFVLGVAVARGAALHHPRHAGHLLRRRRARADAHARADRRPVDRGARSSPPRSPGSCGAGGPRMPDDAGPLARRPAASDEASTSSRWSRNWPRS